MIVVGLDPGPTESALAWYADGEPLRGEILPNAMLRDRLRRADLRGAELLAVEMVACYGMPVGAETFETCVWIGRFVEAWGRPFVLIPRLKVKMHLCHDSRAKDGNVRQALIDRIGPQGTKRAPGPTYGLRGHIWSAVAVAITAAEAPL